MSLEQKLRDNLKTAADALIVPEPDRAPSPSHRPVWKRGISVAAIGAAAVVALALPALVLWSGEVPVEEGGTPTTAIGASPDSTVPETAPPEVSTTLWSETSVPVERVEKLDEFTTDDYLFVLTGSRNDEEEPPTATVTLQVTRVGGTEPLDEVVVGAANEFFWFTVTGPDAACEFSADTTAEDAKVTVQMLLGPSLGCSDVYQFDLSAGELSPVELAPDEVARQFVAVWEFGDAEMMSKLAEPEAIRQTDSLATPVDPVFSYCEGAAGSTYCTFEVQGGELVVRVKNDQPSRVMELISLAEE